MSLTMQQWHFLFMVLIMGLMGSGVLLFDRAYLDRVPRIPQPVPSCTPVDLNRASFDELIRLPLVSPEMARAILGSRREAPIEDPRELLILPGFDPFRLARLAPYVVPFKRTRPRHRKLRRHASSGV
jgi:hypothetical protein